MTKDEAIQECEYYLAHLDSQRKRSLEIQELARMVRTRKVDADKAQRMLRQLDNSPVVYDAAKLEQAIITLLGLVR